MKQTNAANVTCALQARNDAHCSAPRAGLPCSQISASESEHVKFSTQQMMRVAACEHVASSATPLRANKTRLRRVWQVKSCCGTAVSQVTRELPVPPPPGALIAPTASTSMRFPYDRRKQRASAPLPTKLHAPTVTPTPAARRALKVKF